MLSAAEYIGSVGVGITTPHFFRANDGKTYVVKLQNNRLGAKVLVSELLAAKVGELLGLCFPPSDIINITAETCSSLLNVQAGLHFASQYLEGAEYLGKDNLARANNFAEMAGVILFDHMFHNRDRTNNKKNLLIRQEDAGYKLYAIDNSHLFRTGMWTTSSLEELAYKTSNYYHYSFGLLLKNHISTQDFIPYLSKVKQLTNEQINNIVNDIPDTWLPDITERIALIDFIKIRRDLVEAIVSKIYNYIPQTRGGRCRMHPRIISLCKKNQV